MIGEHNELTTETTDLLSLTGHDALEALYDMSENDTPLRLGEMTLAKLVTVGMDSINGDVVVSAVSESEQSVRFSFSPDCELVIDGRIFIIGPDRSE